MNIELVQPSSAKKNKPHITYL